MKLFVSCIICIIGQFQVMHAEPIPEDQVPRLPEINTRTVDKTFNTNKVVESLKNTFSQISSFAFAEERTQKNEVYWALCWKEIGDNYCYEVTCGELDLITAFDGKRRSVLNGNRGIIYIKNGDLLERRPTNLPSPLDLYSFLNVDGKFLSLNELRPNSSIWNNLTARMTYAGTQKFMDRNCIVMRFSGSFNHPMKQKADYDVYFDAHSLMPMGWRAFDNRKFMIEQLEAMDFKTISGKTNSSSFTYPSHCKITEYQWPGTLTGPNGVIKYYKSVRDEHYDEVEINSLSPEDVQIDRSLASAIIDEDSNVVTRLPK
jgi:hypothetical protein